MRNRPPAGEDPAREDLLYVAQMLGEMTRIARQHQADMLCYLLEMAFAEAQEMMARQAQARGQAQGQAQGLAQGPAQGPAKGRSGP